VKVQFSPEIQENPGTHALKEALPQENPLIWEPHRSRTWYYPLA